MRPLLLPLAAVGVAFLGTPAGAADPPKGKPNRLAGEVSPYLLQHAHNPVDWFPWGPEAFAKAKKEGKLVFLSVGYSACHWCHVMERESFANPAIAAILNEHFVCVKVDREERPDVDEAYMTAMQLIGEGSGWPLSVFLTAEGKPIFGGTYWPPDDREVDGRTVTGFKSMLRQVIALQKEKPADLAKQADGVAKATADVMARAGRLGALEPLDRDLVTGAVAAFDFDPEHGGFGSRARGFRGAKFPQAPALGFLQRQSARPGSDALKGDLARTLEKMAGGGIYDHLGGGFHRYSTERTWTVPHFEKMLYDNAQLVEVYAEAYRADPKPTYRRVIDETLTFVAREMTSPDGAFYSALDADSEGREGAFYVWTTKELDGLLGTGDDPKLFRQVYGLGEPNFEEKYHILRLAKPLAEEAKAGGLTEEQLVERLRPLREKLLAARTKRERPFLDTKVLAGWNGQMIAAYAQAGAVLKESKYVAAAEKAADFILAKLRDKDGRLLRVYAAKTGGQPEARGPAFLEDYAFLAHGLLALHDATGQAKWLDEAKKLVDGATKLHGDGERGGFFTTAHDAEKLFVRGKDYQDSAQPSGNGTAARVLVRLFEKTKHEPYRAAAEATVAQFAAVLRSTPSAVPATADTLDLLLTLGEKPR